jgi:hypothetical protein
MTRESWTPDAKYPLMSFVQRWFPLSFCTFFGLAQFCKKPCNPVFNVLQASKKVKNILCMFFVAYVQCKHHVSHVQEGIAALIIGIALGTSLFFNGEKSPKSDGRKCPAKSIK